MTWPAREKGLISLLPVALFLLTSATSREQVPQSVVKHAGANVFQLGAALAAARWPAGIEVLEEDEPTVALERIVQDPGAGTVTLASAIDAINRARSRYQAELRGRVVLIRPKSGRAPFVDEPARAGEWRVNGVSGALRKIFAPLAPSLDAGGGWAGSAVGGLPAEPELTVRPTGEQ